MPTKVSWGTIYAVKVTFAVLVAMGGISFLWKQRKLTDAERKGMKKITCFFHWFGTSVIICDLFHVLGYYNPAMGAITSAWGMNVGIACHVFGGGMQFSMILCRALLVYFYLTRMDYSFKGSAFEVSRGLKLFTIFAGFVGCGFNFGIQCVSTFTKIWFYGYYIHPKTGTCFPKFYGFWVIKEIQALAFWWILMDVGLQIFLTAVFSFKMYQLKMLMGEADAPEIVTNETVRRVARISVLITFSAIVTMFIWFYIYPEFVVVLHDVDISINYLCALLMLRDFQQEYNFCCFPCDKACLCACDYLVGDTSIRLDMSRLPAVSNSGRSTSSV